MFEKLVKIRNAFFLIVTLGLIIMSFTRCSSVPRDKWTDKGMRVMIDPDSIDEENYVQIQRSLVQQGKFTVVDRSRGIKAIKKEQESTHRKEEDRYEDKEKWSHWGKLYGVGSIIVAHVQCRKEHAAFNRKRIYLECRQLLSMVDSNTGEVFVAVEGKNDGPSTYDLSYIVPDWNDTVEKMVDSYPADFRPENYAKTVTDYQDVSAERAQRQREVIEKRNAAERAPALELEKMKNKVRELESKLQQQSVANPPTQQVSTPSEPSTALVNVNNAE